jgi:biopolymer transport protein ExbD
MLYRRRNRSGSVADDVGIPLSPLIDCVFLLLIFFLVTTMLKRKETIIPVRMPDATSSLSAEAKEDVLVIGLGANGEFLEPQSRDRFGALTFRAGRSLDEYLAELLQQRGPAALRTPLRFEVARTTPFQKTIDALDACKLRGFEHVSVKIRQPFTE